VGTSSGKNRLLTELRFNEEALRMSYMSGPSMLQKEGHMEAKPLI
jgi:hypothetical protein